MTKKKSEGHYEYGTFYINENRMYCMFPMRESKEQAQRELETVRKCFTGTDMKFKLMSKFIHTNQ